MENAENYQNSLPADLIDKLLERLAEEGHISIEQPNPNQNRGNSVRPDQVR